jgi:predicted O-linked N-acetylglucosamine transferase (SPINDLY family)
LHDALLTPQVWDILCHSIVRVHNSILLLQTGSLETASRQTPPPYPLDLEAMRTSFESYGIHRSRLVFVPRASQLDSAGFVAAAAAAAADVVVDFSVSSLYALAVAAPVRHIRASRIDKL